jgi:large subunit ribosomal protein L6
MSKIGQKIITIPSGVQVSLSEGSIVVKGPKGTLTKTLPVAVTLSIEGDTVTVAPAHEHPSREERSLWGLWRALVNNMVIGVSAGWEENLEFQGVGYKANLKGKDLELSLGYSHPITITAPEGITFVPDKASIKITGTDKEQVGHIAAIIRSKRLPEPYKGSGIRYSTEVIKKKAGKKAATGAA